MVLKQVVAYIVILNIVTIRTALAISCYVCDSNDDPGCANDPVDQKYMRNCFHLFDNQNYDRCRKMTQWLDYQNQGNRQAYERVIRSCGWDQWSDMEGTTCREKTIVSGKQETCICKHDYCNGSSVNMYSTVSIIASLAFTLYFYISKQF
ncbi:hypothetical protein CHUAL_005083 [Chamberlinius hualienensis]